MREPQERVINGRTFVVTPLPAMRALRLWPLVSKAFKSVDGEMFAALSADEMEKLTRELLAMARVDGQELLKVFDLELQGEIPTVMEVLSFAISVNYMSGFTTAAPAPAGAATP